MKQHNFFFGISVVMEIHTSWNTHAWFLYHHTSLVSPTIVSVILQRFMIINYTDNFTNYKSNFSQCVLDSGCGLRIRLILGWEASLGKKETRKLFSGHSSFPGAYGGEKKIETWRPQMISWLDVSSYAESWVCTQEASWELLKCIGIDILVSQVLVK